MRVTPLSLCASAALALALAATGCGGGGGGTTTSATVTWAEGLCSAIVSYRSSITDAATNLKGGNVSKSALDDAAKSVDDATKTFVDSVHGLGPPETKAGGEIKQTLDGLATSLQTDFQAIEDATSGSSSALSVVSAVSATLTTARTQVSAAVASLKASDPQGELKDAFSQASSCSSLPGL